MIFYGASGHAKVVIESWVISGGKVVAIFDDNDKVVSLLSYPVVGKFQQEEYSDELMIISIGSNSIRKKISDRLSMAYGKVIHPKTSISISSKIGEGTVIMANVAVNADSIIGNHCIINTSSSIDHDCVIGDYAHVAPGAVLCGGVTVGEGTLVGAGSVVLPGIKVGSWTVIGAGSVVTRDIPDNVIFAGNPSKKR